MTIGYEAIMGTVEVDSSSEVFVIQRTTGGDWTYTPTENIFPNMLAMVRDMQAQEDADIDIYINSNNIIVFDCTSVITGIGGSPNIYSLVGSPAISGNDLVGQFTPQRSWFPEFRSDDGKWFTVESENVFRGTQGVTGNLSGISYTARQARDFTWPFIGATNAITDAATDDIFIYNGCFEHVINQSRSNTLQYEGSGNVYCKGVYYIVDFSKYQGASATLPSSWGQGQANIGTNNYVFCSAGPPRIGGNSNPRENLYFDLSLRLTTAKAPSWAWSV
jgi:hypothetical protein